MRKILHASASPHLWIGLLLMLTLFPFYMLLITSFKFEEQVIHRFWLPAFPLHYENYSHAFVQIWPFIVNSILITAGIIAGVLVNSVLAGYAFSRFDFFGKSLLFYLIIMLMMVPGFLVLIPQFIVFRDLGLINTYAAQIFAPVAFGTALATMLMRTFFGEVPRSLFDSAEIDGAGEIRILLQMVIPLSKPIIATVSIINSLNGWNNYIWPLVITSGDKVRPVILSLENITGPLNEVMGIRFAGYVLASLPLVLLFMTLTKQFVSGLTAGAIKG